ncbi:MAG TPA: ABC transporter ATP-binding protein [Dehalococcoidia bacterium]|nr:ABC transporter ATP-binding protein [Dehalococcoidia bacterium]
MTAVYEVTPSMSGEATSRPEAVLAVEGLTKRYGDLTAVDGISFQVERGETFGILGPNGAGKTTTLEMIEGLRQPDAGRITLLGLDAVRERRRVQERIGVQLQSQALWPELTVEETLKMFAALFRRGVNLAALQERFALGEKRRSLVKGLSGGQRQRLSVAVALVNDPELVFLDEPTTGLDPQARHGLWDLVNEMKRDGKTVILTTHYMEEAEALCDRVAIMDHGRIIALDAPRELVRSLAFDSTVECSFQGTMPSERLASLPAVRELRSENGGYLLFTTDVSATLAGLMALTDEAGQRAQSVHVRTATLEDVFISLTGRRLRD